MYMYLRVHFMCVHIPEVQIDSVCVNFTFSPCRDPHQRAARLRDAGMFPHSPSLYRLTTPPLSPSPPLHPFTTLPLPPSLTEVFSTS